MNISRWIGQTLLMLQKDIKEEFRSKVALSTLLLFALCTLFLVSFALGGCPLAPHVAAALLWVILFFASLSAIAHSFVREEEKGTALGLRLSASAEVVFWGKWLFNLLLEFLLLLLVVPLFLILFDLRVVYWSDFTVVLLLGTLGLTTACTLLAAIVAKASQQGTLLTILAFPVLLPLLMTVTRATARVIAGSAPLQGNTLLFLGIYPCMMSGLALLLFPSVWES